jgi:hypothetical protein
MSDKGSIFPSSSHVPYISMSQVMLTLNQTFVSFFWALYKQGFDHSLWGKWPVIICISTHVAWKTEQSVTLHALLIWIPQKLLTVSFGWYKSALKK